MNRFAAKLELHATAMLELPLGYRLPNSLIDPGAPSYRSFFSCRL